MLSYAANGIKHARSKDIIDNVNNMIVLDYYQNGDDVDDGYYDYTIEFRRNMVKYLQWEGDLYWNDNISLNKRVNDLVNLIPLEVMNSPQKLMIT